MGLCHKRLIHHVKVPIFFIDHIIGREKIANYQSFLRSMTIPSKELFLHTTSNIGKSIFLVEKARDITIHENTLDYQLILLLGKFELTEDAVILYLALANFDISHGVIRRLILMESICR